MQLSQSSNSINFPHLLQYPALGLDQYSPLKYSPQCGQRFVVNMRIKEQINNGYEPSIITLFDNKTPISTKKVNEYSKINATLFLLLLTYFLMQPHSYIKFLFSYILIISLLNRKRNLHWFPLLHYFSYSLIIIQKSTDAEETTQLQARDRTTSKRLENRILIIHAKTRIIPTISS